MRRIIWIGTVRNSVAKKKEKIRQCYKQLTQVITTVVNTNIIVIYANRLMGKELPVDCTLWPNVWHDMQESTVWKAKTGLASERGGAHVQRYTLCYSCLLWHLHTSEWAKKSMLCMLAFRALGLSIFLLAKNSFKCCFALLSEVSPKHALLKKLSFIIKKKIIILEPFWFWLRNCSYSVIL